MADIATALINMGVTDTVMVCTPTDPDMPEYEFISMYCGGVGANTMLVREKGNHNWYPATWHLVAPEIVMGDWRVA